MKQLKISLPDDLRDRLDVATTASGLSLGEEIRRRIELTFDQDGTDPKTRELMAAIGDLAVLVRLQTGHDWHSHPAANRVFRHVIVARLARLKPAGDPVFAPGELPAHPLVAATDLEAMGQGLEAINFHTLPVDEDRLRELREKTIQEIRQRQEKGGQS